MVGPPQPSRSSSFPLPLKTDAIFQCHLHLSPHSSGMDSPRRGPDSISAAGRLIIGKQSALAQEAAVDTSLPAGNDVSQEVDNTFLLMYLANEGNVGGIEALIEGGVDVNFRDIDNRTALHVAACQGQVAVAELLLRSGAKADATDRWGSTPLVDAIHYRNHDMIRILEKFGARLQMAPMHVKSVLQIPEYEINPREFDFSKSVGITKKNLLSEESVVISGAKRSLNEPYKIARSIDVFSGTYRTAKWRGIGVAVKVLGEELIEDGDKVRAFRDELELLQQIRHPNVVQFLGAVTQSSPMMIVTEYLPKGDFRAYLRRKGALKPSTAVRYALDIARGMNYLHEHKPEPIIHRDLEPTNLLLDDSSHLKVADFGVSKLLKVANSVQEERHLSCKDTSCRYSAPEILRDEEYGTGVDVFSFALILQEMIEGSPPLSNSEDREVPKAYIAKERPPFKASPKLYRYGLKELIEQCWSDNPANRPTFREIICLLSSIQKHIAQRARWKVMPLLCFQNLEAVWKKESFEIRSHSSFSSFSSNSRF